MSSLRASQVRLGNINISRDWGWADEYIEAIQLMTNSKASKDYLICTGKLTSLKEFINITFSNLNLNWQDHIVIDQKYIREKDILQSFGDPMPMEKDLKWKAKFGVKEIIEKIIDVKIKLNTT